MVKRLAREKRRLLMLQELTRDQADRVQWLMLEVHQVPQARERELNPRLTVELPAPPPPFRATPPEPEPMTQQEMEEAPIAELYQQLGLPQQQS